MICKMFSAKQQAQSLVQSNKHTCIIENITLSNRPCLSLFVIFKFRTFFLKNIVITYKFKIILLKTVYTFYKNLKKQPINYIQAEINRSEH